MDTEYCVDILKQHCQNKLILLAFLALLFIILLIFSINKKSKKSDDTSISTGLCCMGFLFICIIFCWQVVPVLYDIKHQDFVTEEVQYYCRYSDEGSQRSWFYNGEVEVIFEDSDKPEKLKIPDLSATAISANYPVGKYYGIITYAPKSNLIIMFAPSGTIDE